MFCECCSAFSDTRGAPPTAAAFGQKPRRPWASSLLRARSFPARSELHKRPRQLLEEQGKFSHKEKVKNKGVLSLLKPALCRIKCRTQLGNPNSDLLPKKLCNSPYSPLTLTCFSGLDHSTNARLSHYLQTPRSHSWERTELVIILLIISSRLIRKTPVPTNCLSVIKRIITKPL